jgi:hypothetical protein
MSVVYYYRKYSGGRVLDSPGCPNFSHTLLEEWNTRNVGDTGYFTSTFMRIQGWMQH